MTANDAGWTTSTRSSVGAPSTPCSTSVSDQSTYADIAVSHSASRAANSGDSAASSTAIPAHCAPWPGNANTVLPSGPATPCTSPGAVPSAASAVSAAPWSPVTTARCSKRARLVASDQPTSYGSASPAEAVSAVAVARSAVGPVAERVHGTAPVARAAGAAGRGAGSGACSRITCALVPLIPKAETPARRGRPVSGHGRDAARSRTPPASQSTREVGSPACRVIGRMPCRSDSTILITPTTPAAA